MKGSSSAVVSLGLQNVSSVIALKALFNITALMSARQKESGHTIWLIIGHEQAHFYGTARTCILGHDYAISGRRLLSLMLAEVYPIR